ncbi:hypothetical protein GW17_00012976 [Ensete ventricosum]|nr:hypothetical protein GW17_00012976 [Ensete ventricosum]
MWELISDKISRAFASKLNKISDAGTDFSESELKKLVFLVDHRHGGRRLSACTASRSSPNPASCNPLLARPLFCLILWEHSKKFKEEDMQVRMEGKNCMVTGANSGIGYATVEGLASRYGLFYD